VKRARGRQRRAAQRGLVLHPGVSQGYPRVVVRIYRDLARQAGWHPGGFVSLLYDREEGIGSLCAEAGKLPARGVVSKTYRLAAGGGENLVLRLVREEAEKYLPAVHAKTELPVDAVEDLGDGIAIIYVFPAKE
jgi:hypothetical protein